ncbi:transmembrane emp24 domain-containing protein 5 [Coccinella septempunctata]|uniref:transmembrane emp24 domain-containing protein 5 n=1 Tax=Coccinella septempunctata TaxID=41139 RepID=UPI001D082ADD|nr:transmembrane emp24 domain-containing protein 5 [Coccinella septempunctata]
MKSLVFLLLCFLKIVTCIEMELTISIDAGKEDCYFHSTKTGDVIDIEYQVLDGGHGDLDITFHLADPNGRILVADYKKSENNHRVDAAMDGDFKFCFDNTFSSFNTKTVFFELIIENDDNSEWGKEELNFQGLNEQYEVTIDDVQERINTVRTNLNKIRHFQDQFKSLEVRDRNVIEEVFFFVNAYSFLQLVIMSVVGLVQVIMIKSLFDESSKVHILWKHIGLSK